jgi:hypothetical protein
MLAVPVRWYVAADWWKRRLGPLVALGWTGPLIGTGWLAPLVLQGTLLLPR